VEVPVKRLSRFHPWLLGLVAPLLVLVVSCNDETVVAPPVDSHDFSTPEGVVEALQVSYRTRDLALYAELLAADFNFRFQPLDQTLYGEYWTAEQDTTGTGALFRTPMVSTIRVDLSHGPTEDPGEAGFDSDVRKLRMTGVQLEVDQFDGITFHVTDLQDMFFRPGRESLGEDPTRWYLLEWRDLPSTASPRPLVQSITWGVIKLLYN
jgi:hypothetical protein